MEQVKKLLAHKLKSFGCIIAGDEEWKTKKLIWKILKMVSKNFFDNLEDFIKKKLKLKMNEIFSQSHNKYPISQNISRNFWKT